jgi:hypothetical protein
MMIAFGRGTQATPKREAQVSVAPVDRRISAAGRSSWRYFLQKNIK